MKKVVCYFDGCCEPRNPGGNMGYGAIVEIDGEQVLGHSGFDEAAPTNTNNISEYKALEVVLDFLIDNDLTKEDITIKGDSQLAIRQMLGEYGMNSGGYVPYAQRCLLKISQLNKKPKLQWIPREQNEKADELSKGVLIAKTGYNEDALQFGKYKGKLISEIEDIQYLKWALKEVKMQKGIQQKIQNRITQYEFLSK